LLLQSIPDISVILPVSSAYRDIAESKAAASNQEIGFILFIIASSENDLRWR
jgi:hypothetical protein